MKIVIFISLIVIILLILYKQNCENRGSEHVPILNKNEFVISGYLLDEKQNGLEGLVMFDGYQGSPVYETKKDGYFVFKAGNVGLVEFLFKHFLLIHVKEDDKFIVKIWYWFRAYRNGEIKLKIYPYLNKIIETKGNKTKVITTKSTIPMECQKVNGEDPAAEGEKEE